MNPLRIHLQLIGMAILWGASWPWGRVVAQAMPTFVASSLRFFFAIIPLIIWLYAANRLKYAKQLNANQWMGLFVTAFFGVFALFFSIYAFLHPLTAALICCRIFSPG